MASSGDWTPESPEAALAGTLAKLVGAIVIYYALIEHWIDGMVFCIFDRVDGAKEIQKKHPFNAAEELKFLRDSFNQLPVLLPYKADGLALLDKLEPLHLFRHSIVHGHIRELDFNTHALEFSRVIRGEGHKPIRQSLSITSGEMHARSRELLALIEPAMNLTRRLVARFAPEDTVE